MNVPLIVLAVLISQAFVAWVAFDCGYDEGWWAGRHPARIDGDE